MAKDPKTENLTPFDEIPDWEKHLLLKVKGYLGIEGLFVRGVMDRVVQRAASTRSREAVNKKHKKNNEIKARAKEYYLANKDPYINNQDAAGDLATRFPPISTKTYENLISTWNQE